MESFEPFLCSTEIIDWRNPVVLARSRELASGALAKPKSLAAVSNGCATKSNTAPIFIAIP